MRSMIWNVCDLAEKTIQGGERTYLSQFSPTKFLLPNPESYRRNGWKQLKVPSGGSLAGKSSHPNAENFDIALTYHSYSLNYTVKRVGRNSNCVINTQTIRNAYTPIHYLLVLCLCIPFAFRIQPKAYRAQFRLPQQLSIAWKSAQSGARKFDIVSPNHFQPPIAPQSLSGAIETLTTIVNCPEKRAI